MTINSINQGIGRQGQHINENLQTPSHTQQQNKTAPTTQGNGASDTVSLTGTASQLRALEQQVASLPVVDVQRVESIKQSIANGGFQIDPTRVAEKMIQIESSINKRLI